MASSWSAGRPIIPMSGLAQRAHERTGLNLNAAAKDIGRCSELQCFFELECRCHLTYRTPKSISNKEKQGKRSLDCRRCDYDAGEELANPPSIHEVEAWELMESCFEGQILIEVNVLGALWGLTDIWLPYWDDGALLDLIIMIDGEGHFSRKTFSTSVAEQKAIDGRFNETCWQQEHKLLRLHSGDKADWQHLINSALRMCGLQPLHKFQLFSRSYGHAAHAMLRSAPMNFRGHRTSGAYFEAS